MENLQLVDTNATNYNELFGKPEGWMEEQSDQIARVSNNLFEKAAKVYVDLISVNIIAEMKGKGGEAFVEAAKDIDPNSTKLSYLMTTQMKVLDLDYMTSSVKLIIKLSELLPDVPLILIAMAANNQEAIQKLSGHHIINYVKRMAIILDVEAELEEMQEPERSEFRALLEKAKRGQL